MEIMSEDSGSSNLGWFEKAWSPEELRSQYVDLKLDNETREHAFYNYWLQKIKSENVTRLDLEELLMYSDWWGPVNDIIGRLCDQNMLTDGDIDWLNLQLEGPAFQSNFQYAKKQIKASVILRDDRQSWTAKLHSFLGQNIVWAAKILLSSIDSQHIEDARQIVDASPVRKTKAILLDILAKRG